MENYIHKSLIEEEFEIDLSSIADYDVEDIPSFIANKICGEKTEATIKDILNSKLSKQLTREMLEELDAFDEIKGWFEKIAELINK